MTRPAQLLAQILLHLLERLLAVLARFVDRRPRDNDPWLEDVEH